MTVVMRPSCWHKHFGPNGLSAAVQGLCLNFFSSITTDFNISSTLVSDTGPMVLWLYIIFCNIVSHITWKPWRDKKNEMTVPSEDSDQPQRRHRSVLLSVQWVPKDPRFLHANSEDSDQTGRMHSLILAFAVRKVILLFFSCRGSKYAIRNRILRLVDYGNS